MCEASTARLKVVGAQGGLCHMVEQTWANLQSSPVISCFVLVFFTITHHKPVETLKVEKKCSNRSDTYDRMTFGV